MDLDSVIDALRDVGRDVKGVLGRGAGYGMQNIQNALPEALRNYAKTSEWLEKKQAQDLYGGDFEAQERADKMMGFGTDAGGLVGAIKASHGSPHMFDRFRMDKIGTGEGAQAYGHGMYFAEGFDSPVAKQYQENVKDMDAIRSINDRMTELSKVMESDSAGQYRKFKSDVGRDAASEYDALMEKRSAIRQDPGHLYNVELKWPDAAREASDPLGEHHLLDWDAPLSEQPESVKKAWGAWLKTKQADAARKSFGGDIPSVGKYGPIRGEDLHGIIYEGYATPKGGEQAKVADFLAKQGIPGIRYLDQASRGAGTGSRNYVMFDDQFPEIITRNGQAIAKALREK